MPPPSDHAFSNPPTGASGPPPSEETGEVRRSILKQEDDKAALLGLKGGALVTGVPVPARSSNIKRSSHALKLFGLMLLIMLLMFGALIFWLAGFYQTKIEGRLSAVEALRVQLASQVTAPQGSTGLSGQQSGADAAAVTRPDVPAELKQSLDAALAKIDELQKQIDAVRENAATRDGRLKEIGDRLMAGTGAATEPGPGGDGAKEDGASGSVAAAANSAGPAVAAVVPQATPITAELVLLKERNRLTAYADEAIATGNRAAVQSLIDNINDPAMANLRHAAMAEFQRVQYHYQYASRIDPSFTLPVNELFKDARIRTEADLATPQVIKLMEDQEKDWQTRLRAAWLLSGRRTPEVGEALLKVMKEDPVLDVAKEAQLSFEMNMGRRFRLFDVPAIEAWWLTQVNRKNEPAAKGTDSGAKAADKK